MDILEDLMKKQGLLLKYVNDTYRVVKLGERRFEIHINEKREDTQVTGPKIVDDLVEMFSFDTDLTKGILNEWIKHHGVVKTDDDLWHKGWNNKTPYADKVERDRRREMAERRHEDRMSGRTSINRYDSDAGF